MSTSRCPGTTLRLVLLPESVHLCIVSQAHRFMRTREIQSQKIPLLTLSPAIFPVSLRRLPPPDPPPRPTERRTLHPVNDQPVVKPPPSASGVPTVVRCRSATCHHHRSFLPPHPLFQGLWWPPDPGNSQSELRSPPAQQGMCWCFSGKVHLKIP